MDTLEELRIDYTRAVLNVSDLEKNPFDQFEKWFEQALECKVEEPNAMCLATVDSNGQPFTRTVLLKGFSKKGLVFYTNYESRKANHIEAHPKVSANFLWLPLQRQISINGRVERISKLESLKYFISRPLASRLGAWTSPQSKVITSRQILEMKLEQMKRKFANGEVPLPDNWGGYRILPDTFEFWQGRSGRLHDRFLFKRDETEEWQIDRLAP